MNKLMPYIKAYWQITFPVFVLLLILEFIKPGFVQSQINLIIVFISCLVTWIWSSSYFEK